MRKSKQWINLAAPPGIGVIGLQKLHRDQIFEAVLKALRRQDYFAAALTCDIGLTAVGQAPHLVVATTGFRSGRYDGRADVAIAYCDDQTAAYFASPADLAVAQWAFRSFAAGAQGKYVVLPDLRVSASYNFAISS